MSKLRGILPTYTSKDHVILCKTAPAVRNTYELRLALYMAISTNRSFILRVQRDSTVDPSVESLMSTHHGKIIWDNLRDYSVYIGALDAMGKEIDGWVFGNAERWEDLVGSLFSPWLQSHLRVGAEFSQEQLDTLAHDLAKEKIEEMNVDDERFIEAVQRLIALAQNHNGTVYVQ